MVGPWQGELHGWECPAQISPTNLGQTKHSHKGHICFWQEESDDWVSRSNKPQELENMSLLDFSNIIALTLQKNIHHKPKYTNHIYTSHFLVIVGTTHKSWCKIGSFMVGTSTPCILGTLFWEDFLDFGFCYILRTFFLEDFLDFGFCYIFVGELWAIVSDCRADEDMPGI